MNTTTYAGIDVSANELTVCSQVNGKTEKISIFENTPAGHKKLLKLLTKQGRIARACMEATGVYHFDLAMMLHQSEKVEVSVINPRGMKNYADAILQRAKTDALDAKVILDYLRRMEFKVWNPPAQNIIELQALSRRIVQKTQQVAQEKNRLHVSEYKHSHSDVIQNDIEVTIRHVEKRLKLLQKKTLAIIMADNELKWRFELLITVVGIAELSATKLLAELMSLPKDMQANQWVAHSGLDPRPVESGSSINKPRRISKCGNKYLRTALFMPALVAIRHDPQVKAFYEKLLAAGKLKKQAIVAVMRKMLRAIWGMFNAQKPWNGKLFYSGEICEKKA